VVRHLLCLLVAAYAAAATPAYACAVLEKADPKVGSEIKGRVTEVTLTFTGHIIADKSTLEVKDVAGNAVNIGHPYGPASQDNKTVSIKLKSLPSGTYKVSWSVLCDCDSFTPGDYTFTVE
jgi:methionine-rich copper-binding protein CopC